MDFLEESIGGNTAFLSHQQGDKAKFSTSQLQLRASACALTQFFAEHLYQNQLSAWNSYFVIYLYAIWSCLQQSISPLNPKAV